MTTVKLIVGLLTGSLGMLSEAAHSGLDLVASVITFFSARIADRPADHGHPYGHGRFEKFSAPFSGSVAARYGILDRVRIPYAPLSASYARGHDRVGVRGDEVEHIHRLLAVVGGRFVVDMADAAVALVSPS